MDLFRLLSGIIDQIIWGRRIFIKPNNTLNFIMNSFWTIYAWT